MDKIVKEEILSINIKRNKEHSINGTSHSSSFILFYEIRVNIKANTI